MFDLILGLPLHALVIHGIVVLGPLAALVAIVQVTVPRWRRQLRWPAVAGAVLTAVLAWVAAQSGEALLVRVSQVRAATTDFALVQAHVDAGYRARLSATIFLALVLAAAWLLRPADRAEAGGSPLETLLRILVVLASLAVVVTVVLAGHAGSVAVWSGLS